MSQIIIDAIIDTIRKNPNTISIKELIDELNKEEYNLCREEILNKSFGELLGISKLTTEADVIAALNQHKNLIVQKPIRDIMELLGCGHEILFKTLSYLKEDVREPILVIQDGIKRAAKYTVVERTR